MNIKQSSYRPQFDGIRAICIILTILHHIKGKPVWINGTIGVDVFFALSGWLITHLLLNEESKIGSIDVVEFYIRRVFRIVPLYLITMLIYLLLACILYYVYNDKRKITELSAVSLYIITFNSEYRPSDYGNIFGHAWTLGIEEKFYILWPAILTIIKSRILFAVLLGVSTLTILLLIGGDIDFLIRGYAGLAFGAGTALLVHTRPATRIVLEAKPIAAPLVVLIFAAYIGSIAIPLLSIWNLLISLLAAPLMASLWFNDSQQINRFLTLRPLVWIGTLTYPIYLVQSIAIAIAESLMNKLHLPSYGFALFAISYPICIVGGFLLHVTIETPFIAIGKALAKRKTFTSAVSRGSSTL